MRPKRPSTKSRLLIAVLPRCKEQKSEDAHTNTKGRLLRLIIDRMNDPKAGTGIGSLMLGGPSLVNVLACFGAKPCDQSLILCVNGERKRARRPFAIPLHLTLELPPLYERAAGWICCIANTTLAGETIARPKCLLCGAQMWLALVLPRAFQYSAFGSRLLLNKFLPR